MKEIRGEQ